MINNVLIIKRFFLAATGNRLQQVCVQLDYIQEETQKQNILGTKKN